MATENEAPERVKLLWGNMEERTEYIRADLHQELRLLCEAEVGHACDAECPDWGGPNPCPTGALKAWLSRTEAPKK